jgi:hypothetical protein
MERPAIKYHLHDVILLLVIISISIGGKLLWLLTLWLNSKKEKWEKKLILLTKI